MQFFRRNSSHLRRSSGDECFVMEGKNVRKKREVKCNENRTRYGERLNVSHRFEEISLEVIMKNYEKEIKFRFDTDRVCNLAINNTIVTRVTL